jgi:hypothetical protein
VSKWKSDPKYNKFRKILTEHEIRQDAVHFAVKQIKGTLKPAKKDKGEDWYKAIVNEFFLLLDSDSDDYRRHQTYFIQRRAMNWHMERLQRELDCGRDMTYFDDLDVTSSDGKMLVGTCNICYSKAVSKKAEIGDLWDDETFKTAWGDKGLYMTPRRFVGHWMNCHPRMSYEEQFGPEGNGYFTYMTGVEGAEPIRVDSMEEIPVLLIP